MRVLGGWVGCTMELLEGIKKLREIKIPRKINIEHLFPCGSL